MDMTKIEFDSPVFKMTPKNQVPNHSKLNRTFRNLSFYPDLLKTIRNVGKETFAFDQAIKIDLDKVTPEDRTYLGRKDPALSIYVRLKALAKRFRKDRKGL